MLSGMALCSVKSFLTEAKVSFAPVTIVAGTNSSGKSTIFQTLLLLKQAFENPAMSLDGMHLNGPHASVGAYGDWCSKHERSDVAVSVSITNAHLLRLRGSSHWYGRERALTWPVWWMDRVGYGRRHWDAVVDGTLQLTFTPARDFPNDARLRRVQWQASTRRGVENAQYTLSVYASRPSAEDLDAAELDVASDAERYRYAMTTARSGDAIAAQTGPHFCAVEGLLPTSVLRETAQWAAHSTISSLVAEVLMVARLLVPQGSAPGVPRETMQQDVVRTSEAVYRPTEFRLRALAERALVATPEQAAAILGAVGSLQLASALVDQFVHHSRGAEPRILTGAAAAARAVMGMAARLIQQYREADTPLNADEVLAIVVYGHRVIAAYPNLEEPVNFLVQVASITDDEVLRKSLQQGLEMAAKHAAAKRRQLQPEAPASISRAASPDEGSPLGPTAPTEAAVRRFFLEALFHLGPLRDEPRVLYVTDVPTAAHDVGRRGQRAISCLRDFGSQRVSFPAPPSRDDVRFVPEEVLLSSAVSAWGRYLGIFDGLHIDTAEKYGTIVGVEGVMDGVRISPDLTNVGVGVSQVLPILVLCAAMPVGGTVLIEQPELHLHPSVQSKLAVFFAACALSGRQVVLESHSEHLVNRSRLLVARGELGAEDLSIVFIERDEFGATILPIRVADDGSLERWPRGFLDETEVTLRQLMVARRTGGRS